MPMPTAARNAGKLGIRKPSSKKGSDTTQPTLALPFDIQKYRKDAERDAHEPHHARGRMQRPRAYGRSPVRVG